MKGKHFSKRDEYSETFAQLIMGGDNMQMGRHKNLLFAHSRSASMHCSEAPAIPNVLLGMTQLKPLIVNFYVLLNSCAMVLNKLSIDYIIFFN
jgi:hypothetical protein